ncbi:MAG: methyltransferase domain-containing protein [Bacteroidota bacterium]
MLYHSNRKSKSVYQSPLGNAARKQQQQLLSRLMAVGARDFLRTELTEKEGNGLHLNCGNGTLSLAIADLIGPERRLTGIDSDAMMTEGARIAAIEQGYRNVEFYTKKAFIPTIKPTFHFVFGRYLFSQLSSPQDKADQLYRLLHPNGLLLLEDLDLRRMNCFPYSYAFERFKELLRALYELEGITNSTLGSNIKQQLQEAGFEQIRIKFQTPLFLKNEFKQLASLSFESIMGGVMNKQLVSATEIHALLMELKAFEQEEQTMISLPGIYQIKAYRL